MGDFPKAFVDDYVHWLDLDTGEVEFRPKESPWTSDPSNWRLAVSTDASDTRSVFRKAGDSVAPVDLVDIRSKTFQMISRSLSPLDSPENIIVTCTNHALEAHLCRLRLAFFVNRNSELECRNMPGYVIDKLQSCGTMIGLRNQLVLRPGRDSSEMPRRVIIPQGDVEFGLDGDFSRVSIKTGTERYVHWHEYTLDTDLGRLTGNVSLRSKLYQCYLHALTSHCLPDPLLGHTGTEESLRMLQSAAFLSFQRLDTQDAILLNLIGNLTPGRAYYPPHLKSMVTVKWSNLPVLSQHHDFHFSVLEILDHARAVEVLYHDDDPVAFEVLSKDASLLKRTASRNKIYYNLQSLRHSSSEYSIPKDVAYKSRDVADGRSAELSAYQTSWSVWNGQPCLSRSHLGLWDKMQTWKSVGVADTAISLRYSRRWLTFDAAKDWLRIYDICQEALSCDPQDLKIRLAFSLSAASYSRNYYADIIPLVLIFATDARFRGLTRPSPSHYNLSDGTYPTHARLVELMTQFALPLDQTPAHTMEVRAIARKKVTKERRQAYNSAISENASTAAQSVMERWPSSPWRKGRCRNLLSQWFDTQGCKEGVDAYLQSVSRNSTLRDHINRLQTIVDCYASTSQSPPNTPYAFSPILSASAPKVLPSLQELLMSRAPPIFELFDCSIPTILSTMTVEVESAPPSSKEDNLRCLIREFGQSQESLLKLYGEDLSKSYSDLVGKAAPFPVHRGVPLQEELRHYRDLCSKQKGALFSQLSGSLAPSQKHETILNISGLWPLITPRSILRELSRDRVFALNNQWKHAITLYAAAFLKYQQSQRLLELSSRRRDEELLREAETTCEDVAAACSPDWLLIQVSN